MAFSDPDRAREYARLWARANRDKTRERDRRWREANPEKRRAQRQRWAKSGKQREANRRYYEKNRDEMIEQERARREANPEKKAAHNRLNKAIAYGKIEREPCLFCDDPKVDGHHHSYALEDSLNVTWLCRRHHLIVHRDAVVSR